MDIEVVSPPDFDQKNQYLSLKAVESPDRGVLCLDGSGIVASANRRIAEIFSLPVSEIVGLAYSDLIRRLMYGFSEPDRFLQRSMELMENLTATGEDVFETSDGAVLHRYSTCLLGRDENPQGRIEIYSDITFRRRLEREIVERNRELARLNEELRAAQEQLVQSEKLRVLGEMAAGVAHDLNNVLGAVLANVQLLMRNEAADPIRAGLQSIELAALDGAETVRRIRELAKVGAEQVFVPVDLSEIANDVIRVMHPTWQTESNGPQIEIETKLEPTPGVTGNPSELREALANIILNSVQAMPDGGTITLSTGVESGYAFLCVSDDGIGMSEDTKRRLFDPFFTTRGAEGTGLGMSIVDAIITRHGGHIEVESEENRGTAVKIYVPVYGGLAVKKPEPAVGSVSRKARVLVVCCEQVMGTIIVEMLAEAGHEGQVITSPAGLQTCSLENDFDLILVDEELLTEVPESLMHNAAIAALCHEEKSSDSIDGCAAVLTKPVKMNDLLNIIRSVQS